METSTVAAAAVNTNAIYPKIELDGYHPRFFPHSVVVIVFLGIGALSAPASFYTIYDEYSREPTNCMPVKEGEEQPIEPISDIRMDKINNLMFNKVR